MIALGAMLMLLGALITLIAAVGVLRFPDALSRLHAATKAASVGIALVLVGAGAALGPGPLAFTTLVAVFQIVTAPVAGHVLGRSALAEPELGLDRPHPSMPFAARVAGMAVLWVALWQEASVANVVGGLAVGVAVVAATTRSGEQRLLLRPLPFLRFAAFFLVLLVRSTITVAVAALGPRSLVSPTVRRVTLHPGSTSALVATANAVSLTPGTLTLAVDSETPGLVIHLLQADDAAIDVISRLHRLATLAFPVTEPQWT